MENREWRMENGEWRMEENGEWKMEEQGAASHLRGMRRVSVKSTSFGKLSTWLVGYGMKRVSSEVFGNCVKLNVER
ncbi:hypothetical protein BCR39DRAFT_549642, partial [Naematelia encephala]